MPSIFTRIINGEIPSYKVAESDKFYAFLDIRPKAIGHTLCIPKIEVDYIFDLDDETLQGLIVFSKRVAKVLKKNIESKRVGLMVIGTEVPHTHIHLIPFQTEAQISLHHPPAQISESEMKQIAKKLSVSYQDMYPI